MTALLSESSFPNTSVMPGFVSSITVDAPLELVGRPGGERVNLRLMAERFTSLAPPTILDVGYGLAVTAEW